MAGHYEDNRLIKFDSKVIDFFSEVAKQIKTNEKKAMSDNQQPLNQSLRVQDTIPTDKVEKSLGKRCFSIFRKMTFL